jgi:hypothetical protein
MASATGREKIISTGFTESAVNQVVSNRFVKRQQMRWAERGPTSYSSPLSSIERDWRFTLSQWYPGMQATPELEAA